MKLNRIKSLKQLVPLQGLKKERKPRLENYLNEIELILYSTNLCLYASRILHDEINVKNRDIVLSMVFNEMCKLNRLFSKRNFIIESEYTKQNTKAFFKKVGLKDKYLK